MRSQLDDAIRAEAMSPVAPKARGDSSDGASARPSPASKDHRRVWVRSAIYAAVLLVAVGGVYLATRGSAAPASSAAGHDHTAPTKGALSGQPITLTAEQGRRIGVTYATATVSPLESEVRTIGQITFDETRMRTISPKIDGFVEQLLVNSTGQPVSVGQSLLTIYSPMLVQAQEELLLANRLQRDVGGGSEEAKRSAADLLMSSRRRLAYWDIPTSEIAAIEQSGQVRKTLTLRSSAGGYVLEKNVVAGQRIMAGDVLYRVADLSAVWVEGEVFEQDLAKVRVGQGVYADFQSLPGEHRLGRIAYVYPTVNAETRTARVRVVRPNGDMKLKPGMYATLRIAGTPRPAVLTVPRSAVLSTGERNIIFVKDRSGMITPREVTLGATSDTLIEVLRGLAAGETVVASATFLIDAESNLGTALGGMGNMPGMEVSVPPKTLPATPKP